MAITNGVRVTSGATLMLIVALAAASSCRAAPACHDAHGTYVNSSGHVVPDPKCVTGHQAGETAICRDGSHSFSEHLQGTCSRHGGVAEWER